MAVDIYQPEYLLAASRHVTTHDDDLLRHHMPRLPWVAHDEAPGPYMTIPQYQFNKKKQHTSRTVVMP